MFLSGERLSSISVHVRVLGLKEIRHTSAWESTRAAEKRLPGDPNLPLLPRVHPVSTNPLHVHVFSCFPSTAQPAANASGNLVKVLRIESLGNAIKAAAFSKFHTKRVCNESANWAVLAFVSKRKFTWFNKKLKLKISPEATEIYVLSLTSEKTWFMGIPTYLSKFPQTDLKKLALDLRWQGTSQR